VMDYARLLRQVWSRGFWRFAVSLGMVVTIALITQPANPTPALVPAAVNQRQPEDLKQMPLQRPIEISVGLHVSNLADIDQASESFSMAGYLLYSWKDPRLAYQPLAGQPTKTSSLDQIWHPAIEMVNFKSTDASDSGVDIAPDGTVSVQERFSRQLSSGLQLRNFPFDQQHLQVVLESLKYPIDQVKFVANPEKISIGTDSFVTLAEWAMNGVKGINGKSFFPPEKVEYSRVTIDVELQRNSGFYVLKVMIPLLLITMASWAVFWIKPTEFSTQIGIAFTNLLTIVALLMVINDSLPRVGYLTLMDGFTMICFVTSLVAIAELLISHHWQTQDKPKRAQKIHHLARWVVPLCFAIANVGLMVFMQVLAA
jgi:hypothetical protein